MVKIRKRLMKNVAKLYASNLIYNALGSGADDIRISHAELEFLQKEMANIANTIDPTLTTAATFDKCIDAALKIEEKIERYKFLRQKELDKGI